MFPECPGQIPGYLRVLLGKEEAWLERAPQMEKKGKCKFKEGETKQLLRGDWW